MDSNAHRAEGPHRNPKNPQKLRVQIGPLTTQKKPLTFPSPTKSPVRPTEGSAPNSEIPLPAPLPLDPMGLGPTPCHKKGAATAQRCCRPPPAQLRPAGQPVLFSCEGATVAAVVMVGAVVKWWWWPRSSAPGAPQLMPCNTAWLC
jgi:hypothetical protein